MLLVHNAGDPTAIYSRYLAELLRVEGFAMTDEVELADLGSRLAAGTDAVILPRMVLPEATADELIAWVHAGGRLLVLQPDTILLTGLGLVPGFQQVVDGILSFPDSRTLEGLPLDPVQVIVPTSAMAAPGADVLATVSTTADPFSVRPAIVRVRLGAGEAIVVAFDLAKSVARLRHGDPDLADMPNEIWDGIGRPSDLFRDRVDPRQATVPQADILTAVLGRCVEDLAPQPRLWYYPTADQRSVFIQTSDDDWSTREQWDMMLDVLARYDAHCTFYVVENSVITPADMDRLEAVGHRFGVHPANKRDVYGGPRLRESQRLWVPQMVRDNVARHEAQYGRPVQTIRNHAIRWVGYMELAYLFAELGIRAEANYFAMGAVVSGYLTGSGRLARFVDTDGAIIDTLQIASHWTEEILVSDAHGFSERWLPSRAQAFTNGIIRNAAERYYTPTVVNSHPVSFATYSQPLIESNWKTARELGVPIVTAEAWTEFTDARNGISLTKNANDLILSATAPVQQATVLVPDSDGETSIWGRTYRTIPVGKVAAGGTTHLTSGVVA